VIVSSPEFCLEHITRRLSTAQLCLAAWSPNKGGLKMAHITVLSDDGKEAMKGKQWKAFCRSERYKKIQGLGGNIYGYPERLGSSRVCSYVQRG
jgi:hypothetical protein